MCTCNDYQLAISIFLQGNYDEKKVTESILRNHPDLFIKYSSSIFEVKEKSLQEEAEELLGESGIHAVTHPLRLGDNGLAAQRLSMLLKWDAKKSYRCVDGWVLR